MDKRRDKHRQTNGRTDKQTGINTYTQTQKRQKQTDKYSHTQTKKAETYRQTDGQTGINTDRHK